MATVNLTWRSATSSTASVSVLSNDTAFLQAAYSFDRLALPAGADLARYRASLSSGRGFAAADFDRDGALDFAQRVEGTNSLAVVLRQGNTVILRGLAPYGGHVVDDFNADGNPDVLSFASSLSLPGTQFVTFLGNGRGGFTRSAMTAVETPLLHRLCERRLEPRSEVGPGVRRGARDRIDVRADRQWQRHLPGDLRHRWAWNGSADCRHQPRRAARRRAGAVGRDLVGERPGHVNKGSRRGLRVRRGLARRGRRAQSGRLPRSCLQLQRRVAVRLARRAGRLRQNRYRSSSVASATSPSSSPT